MGGGEFWRYSTGELPRYVGCRSWLPVGGGKPGQAVELKSFDQLGFCRGARVSFGISVLPRPFLLIAFSSCSTIFYISRLYHMLCLPLYMPIMDPFEYAYTFHRIDLSRESHSWTSFKP